MIENGASSPDPSADSTELRPDDPERIPAGAELRTFLIVDIRGYTKYTREHGDEAAATLARQFAELVRGVVEAREGILLELRGDEALAVFVSARQALRTAMAIQEAIVDAKLPAGVGIGLDAGEAVAVDGGYRGSALNLAGRLCSRARAGEVLASESVIHLAARVDGIAYVEPRSLRLKGFNEPVRTVRVIAEGDLKHGVRTSLDRATHVAFRDRRRSVAAAALVVLVGVGIAIGRSSLLQRASSSGASPGTSGPVAGAGTTAPTSSALARPLASTVVVSPSLGSPTPAATPDLLAVAKLPVVAFIDPKSGVVLDALPLSKPGDMSTFFDGSFWILAVKPRALYEIDATSHEIVQSIDVPFDHGQFAFADGTIWIADGDSPRVVGIDARTGAQVHDFRLTDDPKDTTGFNGIAVGAGSIWAPRGGDAADIVRADENTGVLQAHIPIDGWDAVAFNDGALWVTASGTLTRIDPVTNEATLAPALAPDQFLQSIAWDGSAAWTSNPDQGLLFRVTRDGRTRTFQTGRGAGPLAFDSGVIWVANRDAGSISGIDATTGEIHTVALGHIPGSMAAGSGQLMVAVSATPEEEIAALPGPTLVVATTGDPLHNPNPDPAVNAVFDFRTIQFATCASLMAYPDATGIAALQPVPEVAAAMPTVSPDGLTYVFRIRSGYAFSPPSNEPLTAETFRFSIERALSGRLGGGTRGMWFLGDVVGAQEFHDGKADNVSGLTASGDELTIRLTKPDSTLLTNLIYPVYCPVPLGTPAVDGGVDPDPPLPSAGPYYISKDLDNLVVISKNPNYGGDRPQRFLSIAIRTGLDAGDAIARVNRGDAAVAIATNDALMGVGSAIDRQWGPGSASASAGDQRFFVGPVPGVDYLALNSKRGLFRDPTIRRAASLALDRVQIASAWPEPAIDHLLPTASVYSGNLPAVSGPQLVQAAALMRGRHPTAIFGINPDCGACLAIANTVKSNLSQIGITVKIEEQKHLADAPNEPTPDTDIVYEYSQTQTVDRAGLLNLVISQDVPKGWFGADLSALVDAIIHEEGTQRNSDTDALGRRLDTDDVLVLPFGGTYATAYVSSAVGCAFIQPGWYKLDLDALCQRPG